MSIWRVEVPVTAPAPSPAVLLPEAAGGVEVVARFFRALGDSIRNYSITQVTGGGGAVPC